MKHMIIDRPEFVVAGKSIRVSMANGECARRVPRFWGEVINDGTFANLRALTNPKLERQTRADMLGLCLSVNASLDEFEYGRFFSLLVRCLEPFKKCYGIFMLIVFQ